MTNPTGIISTPIDRLRDLVASSTTFQSWVGEANEADAKNHIHVLARMGEGDYSFQRPFAIVSMPQGFSLTEMNGSHGSGTLDVVFEDVISEANQSDDKIADAFYAFTNNLGNTLDEMQTESQEGGRLLIREVNMSIPPVRSSLNELEDYIFCQVEFQFGLQ